jgi:hypothetical protein
MLGYFPEMLLLAQEPTITHHLVCGTSGSGPFPLSCDPSDYEIKIVMQLTSIFMKIQS